MASGKRGCPQPGGPLGPAFALGLLLALTCAASPASAASAPTTLTVYDLAIVTQPRGGWFYAGENFTNSVVALGAPVLTYQWYSNGVPWLGQTRATLELTNLTAADAGRYAVQVSNRFGTRLSTTAFLTVFDPVILSQPQGGVVNAGTNVTFRVEAAGTRPFTYQWYFNQTTWGGSITTNSTTSVVTLDHVTGTNSGAYSVQVSNAFGKVTSATASLTVHDLAIVTQPQGDDVVAGANVTFRVEADGTAPFTYQWYFQGATRAGETNPVLLLTNVTKAHSGAYTVQVRNATTTGTSDPAVLTVGDPVIVRQPQGGLFGAGESFRFEVTSAGTQPIVYQWYLNGAPLAGEVQRTLIPKQSGSYAVQVRNTEGTLMSSNATLNFTTNAPRLLYTGILAVEGYSAIIPIVLEGNGTENTVTFSMSYDVNVIDIPDFRPASDDILTDVRLGDPGRVGVTVQMPSNMVFLASVPPTNQVLGRLVFEMVSNDPFQGRLAFANDPIPIAATDAWGQGVPLNAQVYPSLARTGCGFCTEPQTGLVLDQFLLRNPGADPMTDFLVGVYSRSTPELPGRSTLVNARASGLADLNRDGVGDTFAEYVQIGLLAPGATGLVTLEYYVTNQLTTPEPNYFFVLDASLRWTPPTSGTPVAISEVHALPGDSITERRFAFDFRTQAGLNYYVRYADRLEDLLDPAAGKTAAPAVKGTGGLVRWVDYGLPKTEPLPLNARFYQVIQAP